MNSSECANVQQGFQSGILPCKLHTCYKTRSEFFLPQRQKWELCDVRGILAKDRVVIIITLYIAVYKCSIHHTP